MMALWGGFCFAILQWSVKRRPRKLIIKNLKKIFREKGAIIGDGRTTRSFIDDYNESGLMFLDHFFMNAWEMKIRSPNTWQRVSKAEN